MDHHRHTSLWAGAVECRDIDPLTVGEKLETPVVPITYWLKEAARIKRAA